MKSYLPKILITGANGQVGTALCYHPLAARYQIIACSHHTLDITHHSSLQTMLTQHHPDIVINTAAFTAVDKAEHETFFAMQVNHESVRTLAMLCDEHNIPLIHLSTDYVFDGKKTSPYDEDDTVNPINIYGMSKWLGEESIRQECKKHIILRVSAIFSEYRKNFIKTILQLAQEKKELRIVADQKTCPTYASDIARVIFSIIERIILKDSFCYGTYHYCNAPAISWYEFACRAIQFAAIQPSFFGTKKVIPIATADFPTAAKRPAFSVLDCKKIARDYAIKPSLWAESLQGMIHGSL